MAKQSIRLTNASVVSALNNKADIELENSTRANAIESLANSAATTAAAASKVADAAVDLIEVQMPLKVNKSGDTFNGNVVVDGNLMVTGEINATIKGSSESAVSATKDSNGNVIVDTYLKKTGDVITGTLLQSNGNVIISNTNSNYTAVHGGSGNSSEDLGGSSIILYGKDSIYTGKFILRASDGTTNASFIGTANGTLTWNDSPMEQYIKFGDNFIRYASGIQICWSNVQQGDWTYAKPFISRPIVTVAPVVTSTNCEIHISPPTTTTVNVGNNCAVSMDCIAIGRWK